MVLSPSSFKDRQGAYTKAYILNLLYDNERMQGLCNEGVWVIEKGKSITVPKSLGSGWILDWE